MGQWLRKQKAGGSKPQAPHHSDMRGQGQLQEWQGLMQGIPVGPNPLHGAPLTKKSLRCFVQHLEIVVGDITASRRPIQELVGGPHAKLLCSTHWQCIQILAAVAGDMLAVLVWGTSGPNVTIGLRPALSEGMPHEPNQDGGTCFCRFPISSEVFSLEMNYSGGIHAIG